MPRPGKVILVGAGPGDPDLLTVKAMRAIQSAEVVVFDRLVGHAVLDLIPDGARRVDVGKETGRHPLPQDQINRLLVDLAQDGRDVVRLKGGDPFIFGRGGEEMESLRAQGIPVTVVPGVTAASGCAAATGIPLTHRDLAAGVCLMTAHRQDGAHDLDWTSLAADRRRTLVFYMGLSQAGHVGTELLLHGLPGATPAALVAHGATPRQKAVRCTLAGLARAARRPELESPCLIVIGDVVALADPALVPWVNDDPLSHETGAIDGHPADACPA